MSELPFDFPAQCTGKLLVQPYLCMPHTFSFSYSDLRPDGENGWRSSLFLAVQKKKKKKKKALLSVRFAALLQDSGRVRSDFNDCYSRPRCSFEVTPAETLMLMRAMLALA